MRNAENGARGVGSDAGNLADLRQRVGQVAFFGGKLARGFMKVSGASVIPQSLPSFQHRPQIGASQAFDAGKLRHEALVVRCDGVDLGLLQHDL